MFSSNAQSPFSTAHNFPNLCYQFVDQSHNQVEPSHGPRQHTASQVERKYCVATNTSHESLLEKSTTIIGSDYLELLAAFSALAALAADLAKVVGFKALLGFSACLILNTAQAVPKACPAASSPSLVALAASSPYL